MADLTAKQQRIVDFIRLRQERDGVTPTQAEMADHFGYGSRNAVAQHLRLIRQKGQLGEPNGKARSIRVLSPLQRFKQRIVDIPVFGSIPAGYGEDRVQEAEGCVSVDVESIGIKPTRNTFALRVTGDSMIGRHILDGDMVVIRLRNPHPE